MHLEIDLVQTRAEPIGDTLDRVRGVLDPWLGTPRRVLREGRVNLLYRFESEDVPPLRLRLKITFAIDELLATKLRALYQRKKGRDLFDLWLALERGIIDPPRLLTCFDRYMTEGELAVSRAQFEANLHEKRTAPLFRSDIDALLRPGLGWDLDVAMDAVLEKLVAHLPGEPWKGLSE